MRDFFGKGSPHGHTVLHPHKTDACDTCGKLKGDIKSTEMSIKRHSQQHDQALERNLATKELEATLASLVTAQEKHLKDAQDLKGAYSESRDAAPHEGYAALTKLFNELPRAAFTEEGELDPEAPEELRDQVITAVAKFAALKAPVDSDFQQDKAVPSWCYSPQPGPT
jgi:hypothetical protein